MAENREEIKKDRKERINKKKDTNNLIADNGLKGYVIDVYDMLNRSSNPIVIKLRNLRKYGITDEMIANIYGDITSGVESKNSAIDALETVFKRLAQYITEQPNGIVIDVTTGNMDVKKSFKQAVKVGIIPEPFYMKELKENKGIDKLDLIEAINTLMEPNKIEIKRSSGNLDSKLFGDLFNDNTEVIDGKDPESETKDQEDEKPSKEEVEKKIDEIIKEKHTTLELIGQAKDLSKLKESEKLEYAKYLIAGIMTVEQKDTELKKEYKKRLIEMFPEYDNKNDPNQLISGLLSKISEEEIGSKNIDKIFEVAGQIREEIYQKAESEVSEEKICGIALAIEAKLELLESGSPEYLKVLEERNTFYENNPDIYDKYGKNLRDDTGRLKEGAKTQVYDFINKKRNEQLRKVIDNYKKNVSGKKELTEDEKKQYAAYFLVGSINSKDDVSIFNDSIKLLEELYPEYRYGTQNAEAVLEQITNKVCGIESNEYDSGNCAKKIVDMRLTLNEKIINDIANNRKTRLQNFDITKSKLQKSFKDSKIDFSEIDEKAFKDSFKEYTINSWIGSKDEVSKREYLSYMLAIDRLRDEEDSDTNKRKIKTLQGSLKKLEDKNPEYYKKLSENWEELKPEQEQFERSKTNAKLFDFYGKNILSNKIKYNNLTSIEKKEYLRYISIARESAKEASTPEEKEMLIKLSNRAIEKMGKKYITFDENGNATINETNLIEEYRKCYKNRKQFDFSSFESANKSLYERQLRAYTMKKLREYSAKDEKDFEELGEGTIDELIERAEQFKYKKNQEELKRNQIEERKKSIQEEKGNTDSKTKTVFERIKDSEIFRFFSERSTEIRTSTPKDRGMHQDENNVSDTTSDTSDETIEHKKRFTMKSLFGAIKKVRTGEMNEQTNIVVENDKKERNSDNVDKREKQETKEDGESLETP